MEKEFLQRTLGEIKQIQKAETKDFTQSAGNLVLKGSPCLPPTLALHEVLSAEFAI